MALAEKQLAALKESLVEELPEAVRGRIEQLMKLKGVGQVPQPCDNGESRVDQGISKQGNRRVTKSFSFD